MKLNPKYIQLIGDALLPILGLLLWDWGLYFILLFYILDLISGELIIHLKSKKIVEYQGKKLLGQWWKYGIISTLLLGICIVLIHLAVGQVVPEIDFTKEAWAFWSYEEIGIQQGYILVPLLLITAYQQYKIFFLMSAKYRTVELSTPWKRRFISYALMIAGAGITIGIASFLSVPQWIYILLVVAGASSFQYFYKT